MHHPTPRTSHKTNAGQRLQLVSHWRVEGTFQEVADILADATSLPRWWGSVYREVEQIRAGDAQGIGKVFKVRAQGWLPYSLRLEFTETVQHFPGGFTLAVSGDLNGAAVWTFEQNEENVDMVAAVADSLFGLFRRWDLE